MTLLAWARPRRWSILGEAVLAVLVALAAWPILAIGAREPAPVAVVTAYLEALRDGDVERAETFASSVDSTADLSWLTAEAMSSDWEIESVELKSASETTVHAVISSGGTRAEGAFLLESVDDDFLITNPYMYLSVSDPLFTSMEIGGVSGEIASVGDSSPASVALYPGSYTLFASVPELAGGDGFPLLAMPGSDGTSYSINTIDLGRLMTDALAGSEAIETRLNDELAAWLDECAESTEVAPAGCPFNAAESMSIAYDGRTEFSDVSELDWAVGAYPKVRLSRDLRLEVVEPGWMALSGTGTPWLEEGETALDGHCAIALLDVAPSFGEGGELTLTLTGETRNTCA